MNTQALVRSRRIGVVYLLYFVTAISAGFVGRGIVVAGDALQTAANLQSRESFFRAGLALDLVANVLYLGLTALFYQLFEPVSRSVSLWAALCSATGCAVQISAKILQLVALMLLGGHTLQGFPADQMQAVGFTSLRLYAESFHLSFVLFGCYDLLLGWLIARSALLPRWIGILLAVAGLGWLTFLWPPLAASGSKLVLPLGFLAEIILMLWLLIRGTPIARETSKAFTLSQ